VPQRLVRWHPGSGRHSIYLSSHIGEIEGWPRPEAMMLIQNLVEFATQRAFVHVHTWTQWDLVMWDNRSTWHFAINDYHGQRRLMHRITIEGTPLH